MTDKDTLILDLYFYNSSTNEYRMDSLVAHLFADYDAIVLTEASARLGEGWELQSVRLPEPTIRARRQLYLSYD